MSTTFLTSLRYATDKLITRTLGLITLIREAGFNLQDANRVTGFALNVSEPAGTAIYYAFSIENDIWFTLSSSGEAIPLSGELSFAVLEQEGNTSAQLRSLTNIPAFVGQIVRVAIGLSADDISKARPVISSIAVNFYNSLQLIETTRYSGIYELPAGAQIVSLDADRSASEYAAVTVEARITTPEGAVSDWGSLSNFYGKKAAALQFRGTFSVYNPGMGTAALDSVKALYSANDSSIAGQTDSEIYSITQNWYMNVKQVRLTIKHKPLSHAQIHTYAAFRPETIQIRGEVLGIGTNARKVYQMAHSDGVKYDTVKVYFDGQRVYSGWEFNMESARITCSASEGVIVSCDYEYGWQDEEWREMTFDHTDILPDYDLSEYRLALDGEYGSICGLRIAIHIDTGNVEHEALGTSSGQQQTFKLGHIVRDGDITLYADGVELGRDFWRLNGTEYVRLTAPAGKTIDASYSWIGDTPEIYQFAGIFAQ